MFDLTPLARSLVTECSQWNDSIDPLDDYALAMFKALIAATCALAKHPSQARMPAGRTPETRRTLTLTEQRLADDPRFDEIAADVGLTSRSLARRFGGELGMTWRAALRRMRILRAIEMLATDNESVTTIAMRVGYSSLSTFPSRIPRPDRPDTIRLPPRISTLTARSGSQLAVARPSTTPDCTETDQSTRR